MTTKQKQQERETAVIRAPHDGSEVGVVALAGPEDVRAALDANVATARAARDMPAHARAAALRRIADGLEAARAEFARTLALEAGKPIAQAKTEIDRAIFVFRDGAEEATRIGGEVLPADVVPSAAGCDAKGRSRSRPSRIVHRVAGARRAGRTTATSRRCSPFSCTTATCPPAPERAASVCGS